MNHVVERDLLRGELKLGAAAPAGPCDPLGEVAAAVERNLARAHEEGRADQVRLLHAVLALLSAAGRH